MDKLKTSIYILMVMLCFTLTSCSSKDEPEPTYDWWVLITVNMYEAGADSTDLHWVKETRHDERYELNKTESYIKEQQARYDGLKTWSGNEVYIFNYEYRKVDYVPLKPSK